MDSWSVQNDRELTKDPMVTLHVNPQQILISHKQAVESLIQRQDFLVDGLVAGETGRRRH